jgi:hypothetical protein
MNAEVTVNGVTRVEFGPVDAVGCVVKGADFAPAVYEREIRLYDECGDAILITLTGDDHTCLLTEAEQGLMETEDEG